jgi:hypothetical protein
MNPTTQDGQTQENKPGGGFTQGINGLNNLVGRGFKNPFGKFSSGFVKKTLSAFARFLAAHLWTLVVALVPVIVSIITAIITFFTGGL